MSSCHQIWVWAVYKHLLALLSFKPAFSLGFLGEHHLDTRVVHVQNGWTCPLATMITVSRQPVSDFTVISE